MRSKVRGTDPPLPTDDDDETDDLDLNGWCEPDIDDQLDLLVLDDWSRPLAITEKEAALKAQRDALRRLQREARLKAEEKPKDESSKSASLCRRPPRPKPDESPSASLPVHSNSHTDAASRRPQAVLHFAAPPLHSIPIALRDLENDRINLALDHPSDALLDASTTAQLHVVEGLRQPPSSILLELPPTRERDAPPRPLQPYHPLRKGLSYASGAPVLQKLEQDRLEAALKPRGRRSLDLIDGDPSLRMRAVRKMDIERQIRQVKSCLRNSIATKNTESQPNLAAPSRLDVLRSSVSSSVLESMLTTNHHNTHFQSPKLHVKR
ncbi:hypothetical protein SDRG_11954 [Saprolegnia diclina VS20]|uniref:Uncharacterized protein n=1 Tax=Saprolegnia diclina (strain VS20) TaxID=1156394 RepID=T0RK96_SAPDV|nr:hypothetical protein SDRG_11954 [Saprolegnia diclina VS20]EQC30377.1 hypothetical protein SDRG_11954 [Saprolegnia diclina VS20]|eukprot:XP_008616230.1 hypothetical protein SDRG_11954 [Saprolegnia diclina VS20]